MSNKTKRKCRKCDRSLPPTRYYKCKRCQPELPEDTGDWLYAFTSTVEIKELEQYENIERKTTS